MTLKEMLVQEQYSWHKLKEINGDKFGASYCQLLDFLLAEGQEFTGQKLPTRYKQRMMKHCYYNAWSLVRGSKSLRYVEGKVLVRGIPFPIDHAWAIDKAGNVIDPTLQDVLGDGTPNSDGYQYFGIVFNRDELPKRYDQVFSTLQLRLIDIIEKQQLTDTR
jgi:hypothetical protein